MPDTLEDIKKRIREKMPQPEPTFDELRFAQRYNAYNKMPENFNDFTPQWWEVATHVGEKDDKIGKQVLEIMRRQIFDEGKNLNEIPATWAALSDENKHSTANILRKAGVIDEMFIEQGHLADEEMEASPLGEAVSLAIPSVPFSRGAMISLREGDLPAKYKWKSLGTPGITEDLSLEHAPLPFFSSIISWRRSAELRGAIETLNAAAKDPSLYDYDELQDAAYIIKKYDERAQYDEARGSSIAKTVRDGIFDSIAIGLEIGATGGASSLIGAAGIAKSAGHRVVASVLKKAGINLMSRAGRTALRVGGLIGTATAQTATAGIPHIGKYYEQARLQGASPGQALATGIADTFIMFLSEMSGSHLARAAKALPGGIPGVSRVLMKLEKTAQRATTGKVGSGLAATLQRTGYNGLVGEYAEERLEDALTAIFNTRDFGMTPEESTLLKRLVRIQPGLKDAVTELLILGVPAGGIATLNLASEAATRKKKVRLADWAKKQEEYTARYDKIEEEKKEIEAQPPSVPVKNIVDEIDLAKESAEEEAVPAKYKADYPTDLVNEQNELVSRLHAQEKTIKRLEEQRDRTPEEAAKNEIISRIRAEEKKIAPLQRKIDRAGVRINAFTKRAAKAVKDTEKSRRSAAAGELAETLREAKDLRPEYQEVVDAVKARFRRHRYTDKKRIEDIETVNRKEGGLSEERAKRRLAEADRPLLRNLPVSEIEAMTTIVTNMKAESDVKHAEITRLLKEGVSIDQDAIVEFQKAVRGEKYEPGLRGKPKQAISRVKRAILRPFTALNYSLQTYDTLLRKVIPPGTKTYERLYDAFLRAKLIEVPKIENDSIDKMNAERERRGIDTDVWETEVIEYPLAEPAMDENGNMQTSIPMVRSELAGTWCLFDDPNRLEAAKKEAGFKLSPRAAVALNKLSKKNLQHLRRMAGLDDATRAEVIGFGKWLKDNIFSKEGDIGRLWRDAQITLRGYARPHKERFYPSTREVEFVEKASQEHGDADKARKAMTKSKAPFVIESVFKTHSRLISSLANMKAQAVLDKRFQDIFGKSAKVGAGTSATRRVRQSIRSAYSNGDLLLKSLQSREESWMGNKPYLQGSDLQWADKLIRFFTRMSHIGALGFNLPVAAYQQFSRNLVLSNQGQSFKKYLFAARTFSPWQIKKMSDWIGENVPWLKNRWDGGIHGVITPETSDVHLARKYGAKGGILRRAMNAYDKAAMFLTKSVDRITISQIGIAFKLKGLSMGLTDVELDNYVRENLVKEVVATQPSSDAMSMTGWHAFSKQVPFLKPFLMFTSPLVKQYNQIVQAMQDFDLKRQTGELNAADFGNMGYRIAIPLIVNSFLIYMTKYSFDKLRDVILGVEDDTEFKDHVNGVLSRATGNLVIFGPYVDRAIQRVRNTATSKPAYDINSNIVFDSIDTLADAVGTACNAYGERSPLKRSEKFNKALGKFLRGGEIFGVPGGAVGPWYDRITNPKKFMKRRLR